VHEILMNEKKEGSVCFKLLLFLQI
jgi:hypothetical protein